VHDIAGSTRRGISTTVGAGGIEPSCSTLTGAFSRRGRRTSRRSDDRESPSTLCSSLRPRYRRPTGDAPVSARLRTGPRSTAFQAGWIRRNCRTRVAPIAGSCRCSSSNLRVFRGRSAVSDHKHALVWEAPRKRIQPGNQTGMLDPKVVLPRKAPDLFLGGDADQPRGRLRASLKLRPLAVQGSDTTMILDTETFP
jgi:hypothetical protein